MSEPSAPSLTELMARLGDSPAPIAVRKVVREVRKRGLAPTGRAPVRVAVLGSFNLDLLPDFLEIELLRAGLAAEVHAAPYGQFRQELLRPNSGLAAFKPDFTFLLIEADALFGPLVTAPLSVAEGDRSGLLENGFGELERLAGAFGSDSPLTGRLVLNTFARPATSPLGLLDPTHPAGQSRLFGRLNERLCRLADGRPRLAVFDFDGWLADRGRGRRADARMHFIARRDLADNLLPPLAAGWAQVVRAGLGLVRKLLVLDCDNTLWGGIVGEDGPTGVQLGPDAPGNAFVAFQQEVQLLRSRGIPAAVCSKNNPDDAKAVIRDHPHMLLRERDFAAAMINWNDKVDNLRAISEELGLGLESFVFLDDSPYERENVRSRLPMVLVPELPAEPAERPDFLRRLGCFDTLELTREDAARAAMYAARRERKEIAAVAKDTAGFLAEMRMRVKLADADRFTLPRVAQLAARTNQFNLTNRRHTAEAVAGMAASPDWWVLTLDLSDRLGEHGLVGAAIVDRSSRHAWRIDTLLMSCRVLGWSVETALLAHIAGKAAAAGAERLVGEFIPSAKNAPAADYYPRHGFTAEPAAPGVIMTTYSLDLRSQKVDPPPFLEIITAPEAKGG